MEGKRDAEKVPSMCKAGLGCLALEGEWVLPYMHGFLGLQPLSRVQLLKPPSRHFTYIYISLSIQLALREMYVKGGMRVSVLGYMPLSPPMVKRLPVPAAAAGTDVGPLPRVGSPVNVSNGGARDRLYSRMGNTLFINSCERTSGSHHSQVIA
ncbi:hypothetical protein CRG98_036799 [Punica granatum]|uniref:Uncharacterized protein n=1 Tax=Punica granatum TaxID=22663 RepID=A0A2I0IGJ8_PUNGR|nr:hypothetical protein CRG98_036799 [Punica granatum]